MAIDQAPAAIILLINLIILIFALSHPQREGTRLFQMGMAAALICWSGGMVLYDISANIQGAGNAGALILPAITVMLIPAGLLSFALTFPHPLPWVERHKPPMVLLYFPALILLCLTDYIQLSSSYGGYSWKTVVWDKGVWTALPLFGVSATYLTAAAWVLNRRLKETTDPNNSELFRSLLYSFVGAFVFGCALMAVVRPDKGEMYPAPSMMLALVGQLSLFWAIRYLQETTPEEVSRAVFLPLLALAIVFVVLLINALLSALTGSPFFSELQLSVLLVLSVSIPLVLTLLREEMQEAFDRFFFKRAYRYREVMRKMHSELREAREHLSRAQRMAIVGEVAASMAHEIKNPLGPIKGYTQMMSRLLEQMPPSPQSERFARGLMIIGEEVDSINERVMRLLEFSRAGELQRQPCPVGEIVERAVDLACAEQLDRGKLEVQVDIDSDLPLVRGDPFRLREAFFNIIHNGIQAMDGKGRLRVTVQRNDAPGGRPGLEVRVADSGCGLDEEGIRQMFKPFYTTRPGGTGLGLGAVKNTLQAHRGEITVTSEPGQGATVMIWLPAQET
jgi:signal transduction histidine kinase